MKKISKNICMEKLFLLFIVIISPSIIKAQCPTNNSTGICSGGNGVIANNTNINGGDQYWWNAGTGSVANINFGGGTLVVCGGSLTITSGNLNGGTIIVMGGTLNLNMNTMLNNTFTIINYSTINVNSNLTLQGNPARIFNNSGSTLTVTGQTTIDGMSSLINSSTFITNDLVLQTNAGTVALCQNVNANTIVNSNFTNNTLNSIQSPSGTSCIYVSNNIVLNNNVSPHPSLYVCDAPGGTNSGAATWGSATVFTNCAGCLASLAISLISFTLMPGDNKTVLIEWQTASEINNAFFTIERSQNAIDWEVIRHVSGAGNSNTLLHYSIIDNSPYLGISYYRLKQTDFDGKYEYYDIKSMKIDITESNNVQIYPNPTYNVINVNGNSEELSEIRIVNALGQEVTNLISITNKNDSTLLIDLSKLSQGIYYVKTKTTANIMYKK